MIGESRSRVASNGNESGGAVSQDEEQRRRWRREMPSAGRRCSRAEQTDEARAKRTSGDWFLAKARSSRAGAGEDEARATRSAEERRASRGFVAVSQKSARQKRLMRNRASASSLRLPATAGPDFTWCTVPYGASGARVLHRGERTLILRTDACSSVVTAVLS